MGNKGQATNDAFSARMNSIHLYGLSTMFATLPVTALRTFESAARLRSFKQAALELAVTPTAVSHQIKALERQLGFALFDRVPRGVRLTEKGERLFAGYIPRCSMWQIRWMRCGRCPAPARCASP